MNRQQAYSWLTANTLSREQIVAGLQQVQIMNSMNNYHGAGMHNMMMPPNFPTFQGEIMAVANERKEVEQHDNASSSSVSPAPPSLLPFEKRQVGPNDVLNGRTKLSFNHGKYCPALLGDFLVPDGSLPSLPVILSHTLYFNSLTYLLPSNYYLSWKSPLS